MLEQPVGRTWLLGPLTADRGIGVNLQITVGDADAVFAARPVHARLVQTPETITYHRRHDDIAVRQFVVADPDGYLLRFSQVLAITPARPPTTP